MPEPLEEFCVVVPSRPEYLVLARCAAFNFLEAAGFPEIDIESIVLAIDEGCSNVIKHAYHGDPTNTIQITLRADPERVEVLIRDFAEHAMPAEHIHSRELTDVRPGGLGTHFMREVMDEVSYHDSLGPGRILRMVRHR